MTTKRLLLLLFVVPTLHAAPERLWTASWERFTDAGKMAANGKPFNPALMSAASLFYALGTRLRVTDTHNGLSVVVTVTDKPNADYADRLDLSPRAFEALNGLKLGVCEVRVTVLK